MSWWTDFRDSAESVMEGKPFGVAQPYMDKQAQQQKDARNAMNAQVEAYNKQTELTKQMLDQTRNQEAVEKRRIEEKQIRSLRRNYGAQSSLGGGSTDQSDMSSQLGG